MGTDIHPVVQRRVDGKWEFVWIPKDSDWEYGNLLDGRNYNTFAILGDVRNGRGFAGIVTGSGFKPISSDRGLPEDFPEMDEDGYIRVTPLPDDESDSKEVAIRDDDWYYDDPNYFYMGDHSHTWVTLRELLDYDWDADNAQAGAVEADHYLEWMKSDTYHEMPSSYFGDMSGPRVVTVTEPEYLRLLKTRTLDHSLRYVVKFARSMKVRDAAPHLVNKVIPWLETLGDPDDVRIVMGFDS